MLVLLEAGLLSPRACGDAVVARRRHAALAAAAVLRGDGAAIRGVDRGVDGHLVRTVVVLSAAILPRGGRMARLPLALWAGLWL